MRKPKVAQSPSVTLNRRWVVAFVQLDRTDLSQRHAGSDPPQPVPDEHANDDEDDQADQQGYGQTDHHAQHHGRHQGRQDAQPHRMAPIGRHLGREHFGGSEAGFDDPRCQRLRGQGHGTTGIAGRIALPTTAVAVGRSPTGPIPSALAAPRFAGLAAAGATPALSTAARRSATAAPTTIAVPVPVPVAIGRSATGGSATSGYRWAGIRSLVGHRTASLPGDHPGAGKTTLDGGSHATGIP